MSRNDEPDDVRDEPEGADRRRFLKGAAAGRGGRWDHRRQLSQRAERGSRARCACRAESAATTIGAEIPCSCLAINTPLQIRTSVITVDFRGGIKGAGWTSTPTIRSTRFRLRVVGHKVSAELPGAQSTGAGGGSITIEQNDVDVDPKSLLRITQSFPPKFEQIMVLRQLDIDFSSADSPFYNSSFIQDGPG